MKLYRCVTNIQIDDIDPYYKGNPNRYNYYGEGTSYALKIEHAAFFALRSISGPKYSFLIEYSASNVFHYEVGQSCFLNEGQRKDLDFFYELNIDDEIVKSIDLPHFVGPNFNSILISKNNSEQLLVLNNSLTLVQENIYFAIEDYSYVREFREFMKKIKPYEFEIAGKTFYKVSSNLLSDIKEITSFIDDI